MSPLRPFVLVFCVLASGACGQRSALTPEAPELSFDHDLRTPFAQVEVLERPFSYRIRDAAGRVLLSTLDDDTASGYAPVAWADGSVGYANVLSPGYTSFAQRLGPWHDRFEVDGVWASEREMGLSLREVDESEAPRVVMTFRVRPGAVRVGIEAVGHAPRAWSMGFRATDDEAFLGLGERFNRTNQRGLTVFNWCEEGGVGVGEGTTPGAKNPWPHGETMTSYPVPFFLSSHGYGFWLDESHRSEFELGSRRADAFRVWHVGPRTSFEVYVPHPATDASWPYQIIDRFTEATGRPVVPPKWAFGARRRVGPSAMQRDVPEIELMRSEDLAVTAVDDATHFFPNASHHTREPSLLAWTRAARDLGYRVNGYYNSFVADDARGPMAAFRDEGLRRQFFLRKEDGKLPDLWIYTGGRVLHGHLVDFTRREASDAFGTTFSWAQRLGYSGFMYDFGEYVPHDVVAANGMSGEELHNIYPVLYARAFHRENQKHGADWLAFMRSGYTGASAFMPMVWSGDPAASFEDSDGLPSVVRAGVNLGISGVPHFGGDIGGYHCIADGPGAANEELLIRWVQQGALTPNMQLQDACVGAPRPERKATIWRSEQTLAAFRRYARLHTRLFPYLYTLSLEANRTGAPILRHPFLEHPDDPSLVSVDDSYYFGPALYVAPVLERGARSKTVQLPNATFVDWDEQRVLRGGAEITLDAPLERLPLLLRSGHLVPLLDARIDTLADENNPDIVGPSDVRGVYDVVGVLSRGERTSFTVYDGARLSASFGGRLDVEQLGMPAESARGLEECAQCYLFTRPQPGLVRLRVATSSRIDAGGLVLEASGVQRVRWDLFLIE